MISSIWSSDCKEGTRNRRPNLALYLNADECGRVVGCRQQIFNDGTHHPKCVFLLHEQQQGGCNLQHNTDLLHTFSSGMHANSMDHKTRQCTSGGSGQLGWQSTYDQKVAGLFSGRSGRRFFFYRDNFLCWFLFGVCSSPMLLQWPLVVLLKVDVAHHNTHTPLI